MLIGNVGENERTPYVKLLWISLCNTKNATYKLIGRCIKIHYQYYLYDITSTVERNSKLLHIVRILSRKESKVAQHRLLKVLDLYFDHELLHRCYLQCWGLSRTSLPKDARSRCFNWEQFFWCVFTIMHHIWHWQHHQIIIDCREKDFRRQYP